MRGLVYLDLDGNITDNFSSSVRHYTVISKISTMSTTTLGKRGNLRPYFLVIPIINKLY